MRGSASLEFIPSQALPLGTSICVSGGEALTASSIVIALLIFSREVDLMRLTTQKEYIVRSIIISELYTSQPGAMYVFIIHSNSRKIPKQEFQLQGFFLRLHYHMIIAPHPELL